MSISRCLICNKNATQEYASKNGYDYYKCDNCGFLFADLYTRKNEIENRYNREFFFSRYHPEKSLKKEKMAQRDNQYLLDRDYIMRFVNNGNLLDYGCGNGRFLSSFPDSFSKYGYEVNSEATKFNIKENKFTVIETFDYLVKIEDGFFETIIMRGVIEHLTNTEEVISALSKKIRKGGHFYICATPNADSPCALIYGLDWGLAKPGHITFFSPRTMSILFSKFNMVLMDCTFPYLGTPYENYEDDARKFTEDTYKYLNGSCDSVEPYSSPPFPGSLMSLVFKKIA